MSASINRVFLAGHLTRDPSIKFLANEKAVGEFGIAINRRFKDASGALKEECTFVDVEAWGRTAELCGQYLKKGSSCFLEGRLKLDLWEDKKDGSKRSKLRVVADSVQFLDSKGEHKEGDEPRAQPQQPSRPAAPAGDDVETPPF
jgi:single-strand DNA-binding protein